jgi:hypothetical protein
MDNHREQDEPDGGGDYGNKFHFDFGDLNGLNAVRYSIQ